MKRVTRRSETVQPAPEPCRECGSPTVLDVCDTFDPRRDEEPRPRLWRYCTGCEWAVSYETTFFTVG